MSTFRDKLRPAATRKLLALDGGGIRGVISLEVLLRIEEIVRERLNDPAAVLADYFDYVAGTSTGAIMASCISLGMTVSAIRDFYVESGPAMFTKAGLRDRLRNEFDSDPLTARLKEVLRSAPELGSEGLRTLLMLVLRNATTDSPWPVSNNPGAKYNDAARADCNLRLPLWKLVRASTAAPTYFPPEEVQLGNRKYLFVDGGVTMYNNPAFQLFLMATADPYNLRWPTGAEKMLLVSVGTGANDIANADLKPGQMNLLYNAKSIPSALMYAALNEQDLLCRTFGKCVAGGPIDREVGDMIGKGIPGVAPLFTYARYNADLSRDGLLKLHLPKIDPAHVQALDSVKYIAEMQDVGAAVAAGVNAEHFDGF